MGFLTRIRRWLTSTFPDRFIGKKRAERFLAFMKLMNPAPGDRVLDIGVASNEYRSSDNYFEKHYPYPETLTVLGIDDLSSIRTRYPKVGVVVYDGRAMPFRDGSFDICFCNAVVEHVGNRRQQRRFLAEIARVARRIFLSTPNRSSPLEIHTKVPFLHLFLPKTYFDSFLRIIGKEWATADYINLLSGADVRRLAGNAGMQGFRILGQKFGPFTTNITLVLGQESCESQ